MQILCPSQEVRFGLHTLSGKVCNPDYSITDRSGRSSFKKFLAEHSQLEYDTPLKSLLQELILSCLLGNRGALRVTFLRCHDGLRVL